MKVEFYLNTGRKIIATVDEFDNEEFTKQLNSPTSFVSVGNRGFQKHSLIEWGVIIEEE